MCQLLFEPDTNSLTTTIAVINNLCDSYEVTHQNMLLPMPISHLIPLVGIS